MLLAVGVEEQAHLCGDGGWRRGGAGGRAVAVPCGYRFDGNRPASATTTCARGGVGGVDVREAVIVERAVSSRAAPTLGYYY